MAFPVTLDPTAPDGDVDTVALGDDELRALKQVLVDTFGHPAAPSTVSAAASKIDTTGQWPAHCRLTNKTGGGLAANDVVALDTANNSALALGNTAGNRQPIVVARETIADNAAGLFVRAGVVTVKTQGTVTRGDYVRKSATTLACESAGASAAAGSPPAGAFGLALTTASGSTCTAYLFGMTFTHPASRARMASFGVM